MADINKAKTCLALGFFDSVHRGHRYLLQQGKAIAQQLDAKLTILTFNDDFLLNLGRKDKEIYLLEERIELLNNLGYQNIIVLNPTKEFLMKTEHEFMNYLLSLNPVAIIAGNDYTFGYAGKGNINTLSNFFNSNCVKVFEIDLQKFYNSKISTSQIKKLLTEGHIQKANKLLGSEYYISGTVVKGRGIGATIGIPTANIEINRMKHVPAQGIYQTVTEVDNVVYKSVTNVGAHPTFEDKNFNIETLLIGFEGNLYDKKIKVYFQKRIRDIIKFNSVQSLVEQIKQDIDFCYGENK